MPARDTCQHWTLTLAQICRSSAQSAVEQHLDSWSALDGILPGNKPRPSPQSARSSDGLLDDEGGDDDESDREGDTDVKQVNDDDVTTTRYVMVDLTRYT